MLAQDDSPQHSTGKGKDDDVHDAISPSASSNAANKPGESPVGAPTNALVFRLSRLRSKTSGTGSGCQRHPRSG